jgi:hypothetical protein
MMTMVNQNVNTETQHLHDIFIFENLTVKIKVFRVIS